jgi:lipoprotein-anchoring transpeptidase ErfK/SrfK
VLVDATPVEGGWWRLAETVAPGFDGYVDEVRGVRVFVPAERPADVAEDELWIDVDVDRATLGVYVGDAPIYATLVSPGLGRSTPRGAWRLTDKSAWHDMASRPDAAEPYFVEAVPWTMHFKPRYALHAAYWHWGFGHKASHGCVNLAPRDARWVYERVSPRALDGWHTAFSTAEEPGTLIRLR